MYIKRIIPVLQNFVTKASIRNVAAKFVNNKAEIDPTDGRQFSLLTKNKIIEADKSQNIVQTTIRKSSGVGEYQIGHTIPGLRYMMGNGFRCTMVFTLFFLPAWWAPVGIFCIMWAKQMGFN